MDDGYFKKKKSHCLFNIDMQCPFTAFSPCLCVHEGGGMNNGYKIMSNSSANKASRNNNM